MKDRKVECTDTLTCPRILPNKAVLVDGKQQGEWVEREGRYYLWWSCHHFNMIWNVPPCSSREELEQKAKEVLENPIPPRAPRPERWVPRPFTLVHSVGAREIANLYNYLVLAYPEETQDIELDHPQTFHRHEHHGTAACPAGWFTIAMMDHGQFPVQDYRTWVDGAELLARKLSTNNRGNESNLMQWAKSSPGMWGNRYGGRMFTDKRAFGRQEDEKLTAQHLADHWRGVAERIEKAEHTYRRQFKC